MLNPNHKTRFKAAVEYFFAMPAKKQAKNEKKNRGLAMEGATNHTLFVNKFSHQGSQVWKDSWQMLINYLIIFSKKQQILILILLRNKAMYQVYTKSLMKSTNSVKLHVLGVPFWEVLLWCRFSDSLKNVTGITADGRSCATLHDTTYKNSAGI